MEKFFSSERALIVRLSRTVLILLFSRMGNYIPIPGVTDIESFYENSFQDSSIYNLSAFSGGSNVISILTLGLGPFFSASLVTQLLVKFYPLFEKLQNEEGDEGRKKIVRYTRLFTVFFCVIESIFLSNSLRSFVFNWTFTSYIVVAAAVTTGSLVLVWLGEVISERGIGNGSSLLILVSNLARFPDFLVNKADLASSNYNFQNQAYISYVIITLLAMIFFNCLTQEGVRKLPVLSSRQLAKSGFDDTKRSYLPMRFAQGGVLPIIFASSLLLTLSTFMKKSETFSFILDANKILYFFIFLPLMVVFSFFYTLLILSPSDIAKNLKKMSSVIENIKPGPSTKIYLRKTVLQSSFVGSLLVSIIMLIPFIFAALAGVPPLSIQGITSLILTFSIITDTIRQIRAYRDTRRFLLISD
jgi:preprotein translocase subunit SecY